MFDIKRPRRFRWLIFDRATLVSIYGNESEFDEMIGLGHDYIFDQYFFMQRIELHYIKKKARLLKSNGLLSEALEYRESLGKHAGCCCIDGNYHETFQRSWLDYIIRPGFRHCAFWEHNILDRIGWWRHGLRALRRTIRNRRKDPDAKIHYITVPDYSFSLTGYGY